MRLSAAFTCRSQFEREARDCASQVGGIIVIVNGLMSCVYLAPVHSYKEGSP